MFRNKQIYPQDWKTALWHAARLLSTSVLLALVVVATMPTQHVYAATFTVNSSGDGGDTNPGNGICQATTGGCTLRAAIEEANALPGPDTIQFSGGMTIQPGSALPPLTDDATTITTTSNVRLDGSSVSGVPGLHVQSSFNQIQGLQIRDFTGSFVAGIHIDGDGQPATDNIIGTNGDGTNDAAEGNVIRQNEVGILIDGPLATNNTVAGNLIGTNPGGTAARPNTGSGVLVGTDANGNTIGTDGDGISDDVEGNVISANGLSGIGLSTDNNVVAGNLIGTDVTGTQALGNSSRGIFMVAANSNRIGTNSDGTSDALETNVISDNADSGIFVFPGSSNIISGNFIGTDISGTSPLGNGFDGITMLSGGTSGSIGNVIGGGTPDQGNVIAYNQNNGVTILQNNPTFTFHNSVLSNAISSNGELGIDIAGTFSTLGVTSNDSGDVDSGPNDFLNFPDMLSATSNGISTFVNAEIVDGLTGHDFLIQYFSSPDCDPSGHGEGQTFLGQTFVTTDAMGDTHSGVVALSVTTTVGHFITTTATSASFDPDNTSEFSACLEVDATGVFTNFGVIQGLLDALLEDANINPGQHNALMVKIDGARRSLQRGNDDAALGQLSAFVNQTEVFIDEGVIDPRGGEQILDLAEASIIALGGNDDNGDVCEPPLCDEPPASGP